LKDISSKTRRDLQRKMCRVFKHETSRLSAEMQGILMDDMVTAFENRLKVLIRVEEPKVQIAGVFGPFVERQVRHA
jgi:hypothetical protein